MDTAEIIALVELGMKVAPPVLEFVNNMVRAMDSAGLEGEDRMKAILELQEKLKPMEPVSE